MANDESSYFEKIKKSFTALTKPTPEKSYTGAEFSFTFANYAEMLFYAAVDPFTNDEMQKSRGDWHNYFVDRLGRTSKEEKQIYNKLNQANDAPTNSTKPETRVKRPTLLDKLSPLKFLNPLNYISATAKMIQVSFAIVPPILISYFPNDPDAKKILPKIGYQVGFTLFKGSMFVSKLVNIAMTPLAGLSKAFSGLTSAVTNIFSSKKAPTHPSRPKSSITNGPLENDPLIGKPAVDATTPAIAPAPETLKRATSSTTLSSVILTAGNKEQAMDQLQQTVEKTEARKKAEARISAHRPAAPVATKSEVTMSSHRVTQGNPTLESIAVDTNAAKNTDTEYKSPSVKA